MSDSENQCLAFLKKDAKDVVQLDAEQIRSGKVSVTADAENV